MIQHIPEELINHQHENLMWFIVLFIIILCIIPGHNADGKPVFLHEVWPLRSEIRDIEQRYVIPAMFREVYAKIETGSPTWAQLKAPEGKLYPWDQSSTYIKNPPFFEGMTKVGKEFVI
jgi:aconitase A